MAYPSERSSTSVGTSSDHESISSTGYQASTTRRKKKRRKKSKNKTRKSTNHELRDFAAVDNANTCITDLDGHSLTAGNTDDIPPLAQCRPDHNSDSAAESEFDTAWNPTSAVYDKFYLAMGLWAEQHDISTLGWNSLIECLRLLISDAGDDASAVISKILSLPLSLSTLQKQFRYHLPLAKLYSQKLQINTKTTNPQKPPTAQAHYFDHFELLQRLLNTSSVLEEMYFGPALWVHARSEPWHGDAWAESIRCASGKLPRYPADLHEAIFQSDTVVLDNLDLARVLRIWWLNDSWRLEVQMIKALDIVSVNDITPTASRWSLQEDSIRYIQVSSILRRKRIDFPGTTIKEDTCPSEGTIALISNNRGHTRPPYQRWRLLAEGELIQFGRQLLQKKFVQRHTEQVIMCVPELHYCDGFAVYRTMWKSSSGFYMLPANLNSNARSHQRNWHTLTLAPFGAEFNDIVYCLAQASAPLAQGLQAQINCKTGSQDALICGFLLAGIGDMVQQSLSLGVKAVSADKPCRCCLIRKQELHNLSYDIVERARYDDLMEFVRLKANVSATIKSRQSILDDYSLLPDPSPWSVCFPGLVPYRQYAVDVNHSELKGRVIICKPDAYTY